MQKTYEEDGKKHGIKNYLLEDHELNAANQNMDRRRNQKTQKA
jgi:hypothetical protein